MNGYTMLKESYQKILQEGKIAESPEAEIVRKKIRVYEFLESSDKEDLCIMVNSSAFNDIIRGYCEIALKNGSTDGLFKMGAKEVLDDKAIETTGKKLERNRSKKM